MSETKLHDLPDLSVWRHVELLTVKEAALLWAGVDPTFCRSIFDLAKTSKEQYRIAFTFQKAIVSGICTGTLSANEIYVYDSNDDSPFPRSILYGGSMLPSINDIDSDLTTITTTSIVNWAAKKELLSMRQMLTIKERQQVITKSESHQYTEKRHVNNEVVLELAYTPKHKNLPLEVLHEISKEVWDKLGVGDKPPKQCVLHELIKEKHIQKGGGEPSLNLIKQIDSLARPECFKNQGKKENN